MPSGVPEGYYSAVVDAEDFDRYADGDRESGGE